MIPLQWFNDVNSTDISDKCEDVLDLLCKTHGCEVSPCYSALNLTCLFFAGRYFIFHLLLFKMVEIVIPELQEMRNAHLVSIGAEMLCSVNPDCDDGYVSCLL